MPHDPNVPRKPVTWGFGITVAVITIVSLSLVGSEFQDRMTPKDTAPRTTTATATFTAPPRTFNCTLYDSKPPEQPPGSCWVHAKTGILTYYTLTKSLSSTMWTIETDRIVEAKP